MHKHRLAILILSLALVLSACQNNEISSNSADSTPDTIYQNETAFATENQIEILKNFINVETNNDTWNLQYVDAEPSTSHLDANLKCVFD